MNIQPIKTNRISEKQSLENFVDAFLPKLEENTIVVITSKVVSICEGRIVPQHGISKTELVKQEADYIIPNPASKDERIILTYKDHLLIPSAGIDESNSNGNYILYPKNPFTSAQNLCEHLKKKQRLKKIGILITDSHTTPLRKGVTGIALAWWGFSPIANCIGKQDLFGHPLRVTNINVADALAVSAVFNMGESSECTPIALITQVPHITFDDGIHKIEEICIEPQVDLYYPLLKNLLPKGLNEEL